jgi:hypothetical protein
MNDSPKRPLVEMVLIDDTHKTAHPHVLTLPNSALPSGFRTLAGENPWAKAVQAAASRSNTGKEVVPSQQLKIKRKNYSCVWVYFTKSVDEKSVLCNSKACPWRGLLQSGSTSNMRIHLLIEHSDLVILLIFLLMHAQYDEMIKEENNKKAKNPCCSSSCAGSHS